MQKNKVLNVGGNNKAIPIPDCFNGWQHDLLDIDPEVAPDILCDARELWRMTPRQYDAIYCSHNLEHYFYHDVFKVLKGFRMILKKDGFAFIKVPDLISVMEIVLSKNMELDEQLYLSPSGPIAPIDVIFGYRKQIESSGVDFFAHKTGFSESLLSKMLNTAGFNKVFTKKNPLELTAIAFNSEEITKYEQMTKYLNLSENQPANLEPE